MVTIKDKLRELGHTLPEAFAPAANYAPAVRAGGLLFLSGQISRVDGSPGFVGRLGEDLSLDEGIAAARAAALDLLAVIAGNTDGSLASVHRIFRLGVFVAASPDFAAHPQVADGASDLIVAVFGDAGRHARTAVGVVSLPRGVAVEVDAIVEVAP